MTAGAWAGADGTRDRWFRRATGPGAGQRVRLFCLPYAGGGAGVFHDWLRAGSDMGVEVFAVRLPGRERRLAERPFDDARLLAERLAAVLEPYLDRPYGIYGHSMGGVAGLALVHELARSPRSRQPLGLFVGASAPPGSLRPEARWSGSDAELVDWLRRTGGTPASVLARPGLVARVLPALRADLVLAAGYRVRPSERLAVPIQGFAGAADPLVTAASMARWSAQTEAGFSLSRVPGGHFFLAESGRRVLGTVARSIQHMLDR